MCIDEYRDTVAVIVKISNNYLIVRNDSWDGNFFKFPQGGRKKGESLIDTAKREFSEELGTPLEGSFTLCKKKHYYEWSDDFRKQNNSQYKGQKVSFVMCDFVGSVASIQLNKSELYEYKLVGLEELEKYLFPDYYAAIKDFFHKTLFVDSSRSVMKTDSVMDITGFISSCLNKPCKILSHRSQRKSTFGKMKIGDSFYFFKIINDESADTELQGYFSIRFIYPVAKLHYVLRSSSDSVLVYDFEDSITERSGLLTDELVKETINMSKIKSLFDLLGDSIDLYSEKIKDYPLKKYFSNRINSILVHDIMNDDALKKKRSYRLKMNDILLPVTFDDIFNELISFFTSDASEIGYYSQGDFSPSNIGMKPIFFDYEVAGFNPVVGDYAIFFWNLYLAEHYFYPKYHPEAYTNDLVLNNVKLNKPKFKYFIDNEKKLISFNLDFKPKNYHLACIKEYNNMISLHLEKDVLKNVKYYISMRILASLNITTFDTSDFFMSLCFLLNVWLSEGEILKIAETSS
ncbi:NUDIX hydrolase [Candidatus Woesearchaeota archaeon]|nr:NUDIX hydrolase [Candidatus Woesearchaeota archaeon]